MQAGDRCHLSADEADCLPCRCLLSLIAREQPGAHRPRGWPVVQIAVLSIDPKHQVGVNHVDRKTTLLEVLRRPVAQEANQGLESRVVRSGKCRLMQLDEGLMLLVGTLTGVAHAEDIAGLVPQKIGLDSNGTL